MNLSFIKRIDDLGRIVIPKEIRRMLKIEQNENMEISILNNQVIMKKYNILDDYEQKLNILGIFAYKLTNKNIIIANREKIVYSNNLSINKEISESIRNIIVDNKNLDNEYNLEICYNMKIKSFYYSKNIIIDSSISGIIVIFSEERISDEEKRIIDIIAELLSR